MLRALDNPQANRELVSLLKTVLDVDDWGIVVINTESTITFVNKAYAAFFNKTPQDMIGKFVDDAYVNSEPSRLPVILKTGRPEIGDLYFLNGRNVIANRYPIFDQKKIIGAVGFVIFRDLEEFDSVYSKINKNANGLNKSNKEHPTIRYDINNIIGTSLQMIDLKESIYKVATRNSTILIRGQSGTGKELFAHAIHTASYRRNNPFIKVNCAAIPEHLLESELFGYAEGAFTGAKKGGHKGKFELANKGTIFLDEIGDMSFNMQAKLLRVLQEKEIEPLGSTQTKSVDVRIIAATNVNLEELIKYGKFRQDLFYRLNVVTINIPSLKERKEDIVPLVEFFIRKFNQSFNMKVEGVTGEVLKVLQRYNWPGNVRELENVMEQAFNFVEGRFISIENIPRYLVTYIAQEEQYALGETEFIGDQSEDKKSLLKMVDMAEKEILLKALEESNGNKAKAAQRLGISRPGLYKKLAKYNIES